MIDTLKMLKSCASMVFVVKDETGNIIYPIDKKSLESYKKLLDNYDSVTGEFFDPERKLWYAMDAIDVEDKGKKYKIEVFKDITLLRERIKELETDETTRLITKKVTFEEVNKYVEYAIKNNEEFAMMIGDIDFFKKVNDTYGHICGDVVLRKVSEVLMNEVRHTDERPNDIVGRIGGEEILILLKNVSEKDAVTCAERYRRKVSETSFIYDNNDPFVVTMSFGLCHVKPLEYSENDEIDEVRSRILRKCDKALYFSKENGRNQVSQYNKCKALIKIKSSNEGV